MVMVYGLRLLEDKGPNNAVPDVPEQRYQANNYNWTTDSECFMNYLQSTVSLLVSRQVADAISAVEEKLIKTM